MLTLPTAAVRVALSIHSRFGRLSMKAFFTLVIIFSAYTKAQTLQTIEYAWTK